MDKTSKVLMKYYLEYVQKFKFLWNKIAVMKIAPKVRDLGKDYPDSVSYSLLTDHKIVFDNFILSFTRSN